MVRRENIQLHKAPRKKTIGGRAYRLSGYHTTKSKALSDAKAIRGDGYHARVVKLRDSLGKASYYVYYRPKRPLRR